MTLERWHRLTEWPLTGVAALFLLTYAWEVIADLQGAALVTAEAIIWITWGLFLTDYIVCLALAQHRWRWFYTHLWDLAIVVLPMLRPLRLLRLVTILAILQRTAGTAFRGRVLLYVLGAGGLLVFTAALAALDEERHAIGAHIRTFGDAIWWAFETISTVGYGDYTPVTQIGRMVAVGLMIGGIAMLGIVTATLASWIVERVARTEIDTRAATRGPDPRALGTGRRTQTAAREEIRVMAAVRSAGILLYRRRPQLQVLIAHMGGPFWERKDEAAWSIPKGLVEETDVEGELVAASREFAEELGSPPPSAEYVLLGEFRQPSGKTIVVFAAEGDFPVDAIASNTFALEWPPHSGLFQQFPEVDDARWVDVENARVKLVKGQRPILDALVELLE